MKTKEEIFEKLKEVIYHKIGIWESEVELESNLKNDLGCDSLDIVEIAMNIGMEYKIEITGEKLQGINTVGELLDHTFDKFAEKEMSVQPIEKVEKEESTGLIGAQDILQKEVDKADDPYYDGSVYDGDHAAIINAIKEAQRNAIKIALEKVFGACEVIIEGKGSKIVCLSEYGKIHMDKHNGIRKELLNQIK